MVDVSLHTGARHVVARADSSEETRWISFRHDGGEITIYGKAAHGDAFRMMADIFNDAFSEAPEAAPVDLTIFHHPV